MTSKWWSVVVGVGVGVALFVMRVSPQSVLAGQAFFLIVVPLVIIPLHELGHAVAGAVVGFRIVGIVLGNGRTLARTQILGVRIRLNLVPFMGMTMGFPKRAYRSLRWRRWIFTAGGPAANVLIYFALRRWFGPALHDFKHHPFLSTTVWANWSLLALNLFPFQLKEGLASDGHGLFTIPFWSSQRLTEEHGRSASMRVAYAIESGDLESAQRLAQELRMHYPDLPSTLLVLGAVEHALGRHEAARDLYRQALAKTPEPRATAIAKNNIAFMSVLLGRQEDLPEADQLSGEAITLLTDLPAIAGTRGAVLLRLGRVSEAMPLLLASEAGAETKRSLAYARALVACALALRGRQDEAVRKLAAAREADPSCDLLARAEADIAAAAIAPPPAASQDLASPPMDAAGRAVALRRWQRDTRIVAFACMMLSAHFGAVPPALLVLVLALSFVPEISAVLALGVCSLWTAGLLVFGYIGRDLTRPTPAGAIPAALGVVAVACWLVARHRRLKPLPPSRAPTVVGWVLAGLGLLFALPALLSMSLHRSTLAHAEAARDFVAPALFLVALVPIVATRRDRWLRWLAVLPGALAVLTLVGASDWYLNRVALADSAYEGASIAWSEPVPARAVRSQTIATRGRSVTLSPGGAAFFIRRFGPFYVATGNGGRSGLAVGDFKGHLIDVRGAEAAFLDDDRLLVFRGQVSEKDPAVLVEIRPSAGPSPVWTKVLPKIGTYGTAIEIDRNAGHVYLLNMDPHAGQQVAFRTTADGASAVSPIGIQHQRTDELLAHDLDAEGWSGMFVTRRSRLGADLLWRSPTEEQKLASNVPEFDCPRSPIATGALWCVTRGVPIIFKIDRPAGHVTRVPGELPYDRDEIMLGPSRLAILGRDEIAVIDLDTRRGTRLTLPETESGTDITLVRGGLATFTDRRDQDARLVVYAAP